MSKDTEKQKWWLVRRTKNDHGEVGQEGEGEEVHGVRGTTGGVAGDATGRVMGLVAS
jgi:hypothetical protein